MHLYLKEEKKDKIHTKLGPFISNYQRPRSNYLLIHSGWSTSPKTITYRVDTQSYKLQKAKVTY